MKCLITGGAGFIGTNLSSFLASKKHSVIVFDNLSRKGTRHNIEWLKKNYSIKFIKGDIRRFGEIQRAVRNADVVYHLAGQVAVTTSVINPREDFDINLLGTFNVLEAIRSLKKRPILVFSSTNKVYGDLAGASIAETKTRYQFRNLKHGVPENQLLDFHSPYGCSKGAADQYVRDYSRIYGIPTVVFRQSCIYGPYQFGIEDQGWLAWFTIAALLGKKITIYGNGKQTRDILYVDDLTKAYILAVKHIKKTAGQIYNIGGGPKNALSVWYDFKPYLEKYLDVKISPKSSVVRPGDQPLYISDIRKAYKDFGWKPTWKMERGIVAMIDWIKENRKEIVKVFGQR